MKYLKITVAVLALCLASTSAFAANVDNPNGCLPSTFFGQGQATFAAYEAAAAQTIVEGDPVKLDGSGQVVIATAADSSLLGFAKSAVSASTVGDTIYIYNNPSQVFQCQCSGTFAITLMGSAVDLEGSTGIFEVNENASVTKAVRIVGFNVADSVGLNSRVYIQLNMSKLGPGSAGTFDDLYVMDDLTVAGNVDATKGLDVTGAALTVDAQAITQTTSGQVTFAGNVDAAAGVDITGDLTITGHIDGEEMFFGSFDYPEDAGTEWWGVAGAAALPQNISAKKAYINLQGLKIGDEIVSYQVLGTCIENAALTLDATLVRVDLAGSETDPTGDGTNAIAQVTANGNFSPTATFTAPHTVIADTAYRIILLGTTGAVDSISVQGVNVVINRKP